jgi:hypothetical protein
LNVAPQCFLLKLGSSAHLGRHEIAHLVVFREDRLLQLLGQLLGMNGVLIATVIALRPLLVVDAQTHIAYWPVAIGVIYVLNGIFLGREMVLIGIWMLVTGLASLGLPDPWGALWMACAGGGGLIASGVVLRRRLAAEGR